MNLGPGQIVTVEELMKGAAIASGQSRSHGARRVRGGKRRGVCADDERRGAVHGILRPCGSPTRRASGEEQQVTARELADFCRRYIDDPTREAVLGELHSLREFDYPLPQNHPPGPRRAPGDEETVQRQLVLSAGRESGVDGLKTGHLDNENFTAAITARRGGHAADRRAPRRSGGPHATVRGTAWTTAWRSSPGAFTASAPWTSTHRLSRTPASGRERPWEVPATREGRWRLTVRPEELAKLTYTVLARTPLIAPVYKGQQVGDLVYSAGTEEVEGSLSWLLSTSIARESSAGHGTASSSD